MGIKTEKDNQKGVIWEIDKSGKTTKAIIVADSSTTIYKTESLYKTGKTLMGLVSIRLDIDRTPAQTEATARLKAGDTWNEAQGKRMAYYKAKRAAMRREAGFAEQAIKFLKQLLAEMEKKLGYYQHEAAAMDDLIALERTRTEDEAELQQVFEQGVMNKNG